MRKKSTKYKGIKRLANGDYEVRIRWTDPKTGKPQDKKRICKGTIDDAHQMQLELQAEAAKGEHGQKRMTLMECGKLWFEQHVVGKRPRSIECCRLHVEQIFRGLGDYYLEAITPIDVQKFQTAQFEAGYAGTTIGKRINVLRQISRFAVANRMIQADFAAGVKTPGSEKRYTIDEPNSLTVKQLREFLDYMKKNRPQWYVPIFVLAFTGLRGGEFLALKWTDVDFAQQQITVRRNNARGHIGEPKTTAGWRCVAMPEMLCKILQEHRASMVAAQHPGLHGGWVFPKANGEHYRGNPMSREVPVAGRKLGLPFKLTAHGLRRTFNSLFRQHTSDRIAMATIGHATVEMTNHYTTVQHDEKLAASTNVLELVFGGEEREDSRESRSVCPACGQKILKNIS